MKIFRQISRCAHFLKKFETNIPLCTRSTTVVAAFTTPYGNAHFIALLLLPVRNSRKSNIIGFPFFKPVSVIMKSVETRSAVAGLVGGTDRVSTLLLVTVRGLKARSGRKF